MTNPFHVARTLLLTGEPNPRYGAVLCRPIEVHRQLSHQEAANLAAWLIVQAHIEPQTLFEAINNISAEEDDQWNHQT